MKIDKEWFTCDCGAFLPVFVLEIIACEACGEEFFECPECGTVFRVIKSPVVD